jgi:hypothetical protein
MNPSADNNDTDMSKLEIKWGELPVHPVVDKMPMMSPAELRVLAADIKKHGLQEPIVYWRDNRAAAKGSAGPFQLFLLDGRNRLAALKSIGIKDPNRAKAGKLVESRTRTVDAIKQVTFAPLAGKGKAVHKWVTDVDPTQFHLSANVYRRHLTSDQKRWAIKHAIAKDPQASNREIAKKVGVSHDTVAKVRTDMNGGPNGQSGQMDHSPVARAKAALKDNPDLTKQALMKKAKVGSSTAVTAKKELASTASAKPTKKQRIKQAMDELNEWIADAAVKTEVAPTTVVTWFDLGAMSMKAFAKQLSQHLKKTENKNG